MKKRSEIDQYYRETHALMVKVAPLFQGVRSFTMMMVLADLVAQWIHSHPPTEVDRLGHALIETIHDRLTHLEIQDGQETRH
jgi:hypothetical protein